MTYKSTIHERILFGNPKDVNIKHEKNMKDLGEKKPAEAGSFQINEIVVLPHLSGVCFSCAK
jgi:hypothetical protein